MAEDGSMTSVAGVLARVRDGRLEDFVREAVTLVTRELMEAEITAEVGAGLGEVAPEARSTYRNGYRPRPWMGIPLGLAVTSAVTNWLLQGMTQPRWRASATGSFG